MSDNIIRKPRGTTDYFGPEQTLLSGLRSLLMAESFLYGCEEVDPPVFEESKLFHRSVGESSDIVRKETFDLVSKGDKDYTLRPEFTAGVNRLVLENKLYASPDLPLRYSYMGKVFRYERPQSGRLREFFQFGVEFLDKKVDLDTSLDALLLSVSAVEKALGRKVKVLVNFLGSFASRENYKKALSEYFRPLLPEMCEDCQKRFETNPLRILDCKVEKDHELGLKAPRIEEYLSEEDKAEYDLILKALEDLSIPYEKDDGLVRGLDYYTGLVWEIYDIEKPVYALGGGGKYSSLMADIGGPEFEGIGFSLGVERLILNMDEKRKEEIAGKRKIDVFLLDREGKGKAIAVAEKLRKAGFSVRLPSLGKGMGGAFKMADRLHAENVLILFEDGHLELKDMVSRNQEKVEEEELVALLRRKENA